MKKKGILILLLIAVVALMGVSRSEATSFALQETFVTNNILEDIDTFSFDPEFLIDHAVISFDNEAGTALAVVLNYNGDPDPGYLGGDIAWLWADFNNGALWGFNVVSEEWECLSGCF
jgi:hypothetical protein